VPFVKYNALYTTVFIGLFFTGVYNISSKEGSQVTGTAGSITLLAFSSSGVGYWIYSNGVWCLSFWGRVFGWIFWIFSLEKISLVQVWWNGVQCRNVSFLNVFYIESAFCLFGLGVPRRLSKLFFSSQALSFVVFSLLVPLVLISSLPFPTSMTLQSSFSKEVV
jgi:hypothetical protein